MQAISESGSRPFLLLHLLARLVADDRLEVAHHRRIGMRARDRADAIERVGDIGDPVAQRLVHRVLERPRAGLHRAHLGAERLHAQHVRLLAADVDRAHEHHALEAELGAQRRGRDAMHAGAGLGDDARLAHALGQHDLAEHVVHLVRAGVIEVLALEVDLGAAEMRGQPLGEIERRRPADVVLRDARPSRGGTPDRPWPPHRPSPGRGSAASASRRQSGRRRCRNGRARRARCGTSWVAAARSCGSPLRVEPVGRGARRADEGADFVRVLLARRALDAGRHIDRRRARDRAAPRRRCRHRARRTA